MKPTKTIKSFSYFVIEIITVSGSFSSAACAPARCMQFWTGKRCYAELCMPAETHAEKRGGCKAAGSLQHLFCRITHPPLKVLYIHVHTDQILLSPHDFAEFQEMFLLLFCSEIYVNAELRNCKTSLVTL